MITIVFDTNIFDILAQDEQSCELMRKNFDLGLLRVVVTRTIKEELMNSPFKGIPNLFPFEYIGNTVGRADVMCAGDSIGNGEIYERHLGKSAKTNDAFIVDASSLHSDWLVSEDERLRRRTHHINANTKPMSYSAFLIALNALQPKPNDA